MSKKNLEKGDGGGKTKQCPVCGEFSSPGENVCAGCSFTFGEDSIAEPTAQAGESLVCNECGAELPPGTESCFICGAEMTAKAQAAPGPEPSQEEDWDPGTVGGDASSDAEPMPEEDIPDIPEEPVPEAQVLPENGLPIIDENHFRCPNCRKPVTIGTSKCPECWTDMPEMIGCPKCESLIPLASEICSECFAKLRNGVLIEEPAEEPLIASEIPQEVPAEEMSEEEMEDHIEEISEVYGVECPFCHEMANPSDDICPECGMPLIEKEPEEEEKEVFRKPERDWYRIIALGVVVVLLISGILPFAVPLPHIDRIQIRIDGAFGDWGEVTGQNDTELLTLNPNIDIIDTKLLSDAFNLYFYYQVRGQAFGDASGDTARIFIDTDQNPATGYRIMGLGADYQIRVFGHAGIVESSSCLAFDNSGLHNDFNGFTSICPSVPHAADQAQDNDKFEVRVALEDIGITQTTPVTAVFYMGDSNGGSDYSHLPNTNQGSVLFVRQTSLVPASGILTGSSASVLSLEMFAIHQPVMVNSITVPECGAGAFERTVQDGTPVQVTLTTGAGTPGSLISRIASPANINAGDDTHVVVVGQGAYAYSTSPPSLITIDGAFADWNGKGLAQDDAADDQLSKAGVPIVDEGLDLVRQTSAREDNRLNFLVQTTGDILAGMWVPEIEETYLNTATGTKSADATQDYTYTQPDVSRTRAPDIQRPTTKPVKTGEGAILAYIDTDNDTATGYSVSGIGADYLVKTLGQDGTVTGTYLYTHSGTDRNQENWVLDSSVPDGGKAAGSRVEIGIPLLSFADISHNASAVVRIIDWNQNGDIADIALWDVFETNTRSGTRNEIPKIGGVRGKATSDGATPIGGTTIVMKSSVNGRIHSYVSFEPINLSSNNYFISQGFGFNNYVSLHAVNNTHWDYARVMYPADDEIGNAVTQNLNVADPIPEVLPVDFTLTNLPGDEAIRLNWNHASDPATFNLYRTNRTTNYDGYEGRGRYYGLPAVSGITGTATEYLDYNPVKNQTNYYILEAVNGPNYNFSMELNMVADFWAPEIAHTELDTYYASMVPITADMTDGYGVQSATVYYRKGTSGAWAEAPMALENGTAQDGTWQAWIPVDMGGQPSVDYQYYISAGDGSQNALCGGPGGPGNPEPLDFTAETPGEDPYPIYGYVKWADGSLVGPGVQVWIEWVNTSGPWTSSVIHDPNPGMFPYITNAASQYSVDMMQYDQNSLIWGNATIGGIWGYNTTFPNFPYDGGKMFNITLETGSISISKGATLSANADEDITYTVTVTNTGNTTVYNLNITETYPPEVTYVNAVPLPTFADNVWIVPSLAPGASYVITITVHIAAGTPMGTVVTNYVKANCTNSVGTIFWPEVDAWANTTIGAALLSITKWAPTYANPGEIFSYWLNYTNMGSQAAANVVITETYPAGVTFVSSIPAPSIGNNVWIIGTLNPGDSNSIEIRVQVDATATGILMNMANITSASSNTDWAFANTTVRNPLMDITKTGPFTANANETFMYTITYQNLGADTAYDVWIYETYPAGVTLQNANPAPTVWPGTWFIGNLAAGASGTIFINVTVNSGFSGTLVNQVRLAYDNSVGAMPDEYAWWNTTVANPAMFVEKLVQAFANTGETIVYTIHYRNTGTDWAYNINITETYPLGVTYQSAIPAPTFGNNVWIIPVLAPGADGWIDITVLVSPTASGTITNTVSVTFEDFAGQNLGPITDTASFTIADPLLTIDKQGPAVANSGETITYTILVTNIGTAPAENVVVTENYPAGVTFQSSIPVPSVGNNVWNIPFIAAPGNFLITITVLINPTATLPQVNWVFADYQDGSGEDQAQVSDSVTTVLNNPLLEVAKNAPATALPDQDITYTISVHNIGSEPAYNVTITETYPAGVTFVSAIPAPTTPNNIWFVSAIMVGGYYNISITVHILAGTTGLLNNSVVVDYESSSHQDYQAIAWDTTMVTWPMMNIQKTGPANATAGSTIMYTVTYWNSGSDTAYDVTITETYPAGSTFVNSTPAPTSGNNVWVIPTVAAGAGGVIFINITLSPTASGILVNTVTLAYNNTENQAMPEVSDEWYTFINGPWMTVSKTGPATANSGQTIVYTITYENIGDAAAHNVTVTDNLPVGVTYVSSVPAGSVAGSVITWNIGTVAAGATGTITVTVTVNTATMGDITNWVYLNYRNNASVSLPEMSDDWTTAILDPLMILSKTGPATANPGGPINYTITYQNIGNGVATNVVIVDTLPAGVAFVSAFPAPTSVVGQVLTWNIGLLNPGQGGVILVNVTVTTSIGPILNTATLNYRDLANEVQPTVIGTWSTNLINPLLTVQKTGPATAAPGQIIVFTITVRNVGNDWAYNIWVNDTLPAGMTFIGSVPGFNTSAPPIYTWYVAAMAPGGSYTIQITVQIDPAASGVLENTVAATYENAAHVDQPVESDTLPITIIGCIVTVDKTAPANANTGETITYTITYENTGLDWAYNVVVTDTLPPGVTYVGAIPAPVSVVGQILTWNIGSVGPGASGSIDITVTVNTGLPIGTVLTNDVAVDYENAGGLAAQDTDSAATTIIDPVLTITKAAPATAAPGETIVYTITYQNTGTDTAYNVAITDTLPAGVAYVTASVLPFTVVGQVITWNIGTVAPGAPVIILVTVTVSTSATGVLTNNVQIAGYNDEGVQFTDQDTVDTLVQGPYMDIQKTGPVNASPGQTITYTITYANTGPGIAYDVTITETYPVDITFVSAVPPPTAGNNVWDLGNLASGASGVITVTVTVNGGATLLINNVTVDYALDPGLVNWAANWAEWTTVVDSPLLTISKTAPATAVTGQTITYTIMVENVGTNVANSVIVTETYPAGVTFVGAMPWPSAGNNVWDLTTIYGMAMPIGAVWTITITLTVDNAAIGILHNVVIVAYTNQVNGAMPVEWAFADTLVVDPLLTVVKTAPAYANTGETITYTITVTNVGTAPAYDITITETYPAGVTFISAIPAPTSGNNVWNVAFLDTGASYVITITVQVTAAAGTLVNTADVTYENFAGRIMPAILDTAQTIIRNPDMAVTKWAPENAYPGQTITYWLNYTNTGTDWAYNVTITETYPAGVNFISSLPPPTSGNNVWFIPAVAPGGSGSIRITVQIILGTEGWTLVNNAELDYQNAADISQPTEYASDSTLIIQPNMTITKTAPGTAIQGQTITYTLTYQNTGTGWAYDVIITEAYPAGVTFVNAVPAPTVPNNIWFIGNLAPGTGGSIVITVIVDAGATGILTNWAYLDYENPIGTDLEQVSASASTLVQIPVMTISKTAPATANTGQTIVYTIFYQNVGMAPAYNVVITDTLPIGVNFVSSVPVPSVSAYPVYTWNIAGTLAPGASGTITVTVTVTATTGLLINTANVNYRNQFGVVYPTVWDTDTTEIINPLLTVEKSAPATANTGQNIVYTVWVNNTGTDMAYNVVVTETYPAGVIFVGAVPMPSSGNNVWNLGNRAPGAAVPIFITVTVNATGLLVNTVTVNYNNSVPIQQTPVTDTAETLVGDPLIVIQKTAPATANAGETIMYTIRYWNNGTAPAYNVIITEIYPAGVTFVNANPAPTFGNNVWNIGTVPVGGSGVIFINVTVNSGTTGILVNTVQAEYEDAAGNIRPVVTDQAVTVITGPYLVISKTGPAFANPGQVIMYTITYQNIGTDIAYNVWINETFPAGVTFLNSNPARTSDFNWNIGDLVAGASGRIYINVTVSATATGTLHNFVNAAWADSVGARYNANATWDTVIREPIIQLVKTGPAGANPGATITYWINYTNAGSDWAHNVTITETYPAGVTFVSSLPAPTAGNNVWYIGSVAPGASGSIRITVTISVSAEGSITNTARATFRNQAGSNMDPVTATFVTLIINPLIQLEKLASTTVPGSVFPNEIFTYEIRYSNIGTDWAYNVRITETYPAGVTFQSAVPAPNFGDNEWLIPMLAPGAGGSIFITVRVDSGATGTLLNRVTANYRNTVGPMTPVVAELSLTVIAPNLQVTKTAPAAAATGELITYTVTVRNIGNALATGIILTEAYPAGVTFVSAVPAPDISPNRWFVWDLAPGASWSVDITVQVNLGASGMLINNVAATCLDQYGQAYGPFNAQAMTLVADPYMLVSKTGPATANPGATIMYTITYQNIGTGPADVIITESYPAGTAFLDATPMPTSGDNVWNIGTVNPGASGTIFVNVTIGLTASGTLTDMVSLAYSSNVRPFPQQYAFWNTTIVEPRMVISKTAPATANTGQQITYWLNFSNTGTDWAYGVVITETYPAGVTFVSSIPVPTAGNNVWDIGDIAPGGSGSIMITVRVNTNAFGILRNFAVLAYSSAARTMPPAYAWANTTVVDPLLIMSKTAPATATQGETVTYTITIENIGTDTAYNVYVQENYPASVSYVSAVPAPFLGNNVWYFATVPAGGTVTITITVTFSMSANLLVINFAFADYQDFAGEDQARVQANAGTYVTGPTMQFTKWATPHANATDLITYYLNFTNTGTGWAQNVVVTETYPAGATFVSAIPAPTAGNNVWNIGNVAPGATVSIVITMQVDIGATGILFNRATLDYQNLIGIDYRTLRASAITTLGDIPNIIIDKTALAYANAGQVIMYRIDWSNPTAIWAYNVWINDTLPYGTAYLDSNPTPPDHIAPPVYGWSLGDLAPGASGTIFINVTVTGERYGTLTNLAVVEWLNSTGFMFTGFDTANTVVRDALMDITKTGPLTASVGQVFSYTMSYVNLGNGTAYDVWIVDTLPAGVTYLPVASPPPTSVVGQVISWNFATIAAGFSGTITVTVQVQPAASGTVQTNTVTLDYDNTIGVPYPQEFAYCDTLVNLLAGFMVIEKWAPAEAVTGETITYLLNYTNIGLGAANNVVITETYDAGVVFVDAFPAPTTPPDTWTLGNLPAGASGTIMVNVTVTAASGTLTNWVDVTYIGGADMAWASTVIVAPLMDITKSVNRAIAQNGDLLTYTVSYFNIGTAPAYNVVITETYPAGVAFGAAVPAPTIGNNVWEIPFVPVGGSGTITITVTVTALTGVQENNVSLDYENIVGIAQPTEYAEASTDISTVELTITKMADPTVNPGSNMFYYITIDNPGLNPANDVTITETYPAGITFVNSWLSIMGGPWNLRAPDVGDNIWYLGGPLPAGSYWTLMIEVTVDPLAPDVLVNTAMLNFTDAFTNHFLNDTAVTVTSGPMMELEKTANYQYVSPGQLLTYTITYTNVGPGPAMDVVIREYYPSWVTFVSAVPMPNIGNNVWNLGMVDGIYGMNTGQIVITVRVSTMAAGQLTNWASLNYRNISGAQMPEEWASATTTVLGGVTLMSITKTGPTMATSGELVTYIITYRNIGTGMAVNVYLDDVFDLAELTFVSATPPPTYTIGNTRRWVIGNVAPGAMGTISVSFTVGSGIAVANNRVYLNYTNSLGTSYSRTTLASTLVYNPTMTITKTAPATANSGQYITYTIIYTNTNQYAFAHNVAITETYSVWTSFFSATPAPTLGDNYWFIGDVAPGASASIQITVRILTAATNDTWANNRVDLAYENMANVPQPGEFATAQTHVLDPILTIDKDGPGTANSGQAIQYTILVRNTGGAPAYDLVITEAYPGGITFVSAVPAPTIGNNVWIIPMLAVGGVYSITINVIVNTNVASTTPLTNTATVTYEDANNEAQDPESDFVITTVLDPLLQVTKTGPAVASTGQNITYLITIENTGQATAYNIQVTDIYPSNMTAQWVTYVNSTPGTVGPGFNTWTIATLAPGAIIYIWINVTVNVQYNLTNTVTVDYTDFSMEAQAQVSDSWTTWVQNPYMTLTKIANITAVPGGYILYNLTAENIGTGNATGVTVTEHYPAGVTFVWASIPPTTGNNVWVFDDLPAGFAGSLLILVRVDNGTAPGTVLRNTVNMTYGSLANMAMPPLTAWANTTVEGPIMHIEKTAPANVSVGEIFNYTIRFWNTGTAPAYNVIIRDALPGGLGVLAVYPPPSSTTGGYYEWTFEAGDPGTVPETVGIIQITVQPTRAAILTNNATLSYTNSADMVYPTIFSVAVTLVGEIPGLIPPIVRSVPPAYEWAGEDFVLFAEVIAMGGSSIGTVRLYFTGIYGDSWSADMTEIAGAVNIVNGTGWYRCPIPAQPYKGFVSYFVWVNDTNELENRTGILDIPIRLPPYFVWGFITSRRDTPVSNAIVQVTDTFTNETVMALTDSSGRYQVDLATLYSGYMNLENLAVYATDGMYYGTNESFIDLDDWDDADMTWPNRLVSIRLSEIPEFGSFIVPILAILALVVLLGRQRRKRHDEASN